jgi:serine/threonine protein kinase
MNAEPAPAPRSLAPGTQLGPYTVIAPLGAGGMGEVFRARDTRLGREVAIKILPTAVYVPSYWFSLVHAGLGDVEETLRWLERAYQERSTILAYLRIDPRLRLVRDNPRFVALSRRIAGD